MQNSPGSKTETEPLHTDYPEKGKVNLFHAGRGNQRNPLRSFFRTLMNYISLLCTVYPTPCAIFMFACIGLVLFGIGEAIFNPRVKYGYIAHDHSNLKSVFDYRIANIDHWCLRGDSDSCRCEDPLQPISRAEHNSWKVAFATNRKIVKALESDPSSDVDIAFVGESVVEEMDGRWMGMMRGGQLQRLKEIFDSYFNKGKGGQLSGVALGIAGDTSPNVLFRLMHGELSQKIHPKIYWLALGMNDLSRMQCSEEVVVLGILRVVEEIIKNTNSYVVINSIFPMSQMRGAAYPVLSDATEAFETPQGRNRMRFRHRPARTTDPNLAVVRQPRFNNNGRFLQRFQQGRPRVQLTDDQIKEAAEKEERARDALYRQNIQRQRLRPRNRNPVTLQEMHHIRKHANANKLPLWTSVLSINRQLASYAAKNKERIYYFDATSSFAERSDARTYHLRLDRITPKGHPTLAGYKAWEEAVAHRAMALVKRWKEEHPNVYVPKDDDEDPLDMDAVHERIEDMDDAIDDKAFQHTDDAWRERLQKPGDDYYGEEGDNQEGNDDDEEDNSEGGDDEYIN